MVLKTRYYEGTYWPYRVEFYFKKECMDWVIENFDYTSYQILFNGVAFMYKEDRDWFIIRWS